MRHEEKMDNALPRHLLLKTMSLPSSLSSSTGYPETPATSTCRPSVREAYRHRRNKTTPFLKRTPSAPQTMPNIQPSSPRSTHDALHGQSRSRHHRWPTYRSHFHQSNHDSWHFRPRDPPFHHHQGAEALCEKPDGLTSGAAALDLSWEAARRSPNSERCRFGRFSFRLGLALLTLVDSMAATETMRSIWC